MTINLALVLFCLISGVQALPPAPSSKASVSKDVIGVPDLPWKPTPLDIAMAKELSRAAAGLQQEGYPLPYYIGLNAADNYMEDLRCTLGGVYSQSSQSQRSLTADVRVGSYELDNHPMAPSATQSYQELPQNGDEFGIRHDIWQELDERYKAAAADFLRKQALRVRRGKTEYDTDDLTRESPMVMDAVAPIPVSNDVLGPPERERKLCLDLSAIFRKKPSLLGSRVVVTHESSLRRFFDSPGTRVRYGTRAVRVSLDAEELTSDGMKVFGSRSFLAPSVEDFPDSAALTKAAEDILADLNSLQAAHSTSPFSAPALVDPSVGGVILQAFAGRLSGEQQRNPEGAQTFRDKLGKKILPHFLSLIDDPTMETFEGHRLMGHYRVDDQGVLAQRVTLVEDGILRSYLLSRYPILGFNHSNGHGRASPGRVVTGRPGNLLLKSSTAYSQERLIELLRQECIKRGKPYGLWIMKTRSWRQQDTTDQQQAFRLLPTLVYLVDAKTGKKELVRDLDMVGTPLNLVGRILAVGNDARAINAMMEDASGPLTLSIVVPTLLLQEVELQRAETKPERPPVLPAPQP